ncbi:MAG: hypothetical protein JSS52_11405 [Proteobacteria bacterium]|nr:hypothetical protein [Pseudomonadota bacterium]
MTATAQVDPPRYVESVPTATSPVNLPDLRKARASFLAGVITGGVLAVIAAVELVAGLVVIA